ncbi:MAG: ATP-binding protein [Simkaniaceae bacterium]|nr:ATP-binding protein [Simkaniaceae bacterium]
MILVDSKLSWRAVWISLVIAGGLYAVFALFAERIALHTFDQAFLTRGHEVIDRISHLDDPSEIAFAMKVEDKQSSCRYALIGPRGKAVYDSISRTDPAAMRILLIHFELGGEPHKLKIALSRYLSEIEVNETKEILLLCAAGFCMILWVCSYFLIAMKEGVSKQEEQSWHADNEKEMLLEHIEEGVVVVDSDLKLLNVNRKAARMLDVLKMHLIGTCFEKKDNLSPLGKACCQVLKRAAGSGGVAQETMENYEIVAFPAYGDKIVAILRDCSSTHKMMKMGRDFVANASHELRTPITIIKGFVETLSDMPQVTEAMLDDILEKVLRSCERMEGLIKNLLILADLDYLPDAQKKVCELVTLVDSCRRMVSYVHPNAKIEVIPNKEEIFIRADPDLLELAIMNLIQNGVKYSGDDPYICVKVEEILGEVRLTIADRGCGIPEKDLKNIFDRFYTVDKARSRKLGGAGLGLSIVKTIIEHHEGNITAHSKVGVGTEFTAALPKR